MTQGQYKIKRKIDGKTTWIFFDFKRQGSITFTKPPTDLTWSLGEIPKGAIIIQEFNI